MPNVQFLQNQILQHSLLAQWWMTRALTGEAKTRQIFHGFTGPEYTNKEKINDAVNIAKRHIEIVSELNEKLYELMH